MSDLRQIFQDERAPRPSVVAKAAPKQVERERLFDVLRRAIVDGQIAPGTRLTERKLCEAFDVSRTVVREVIRMIAAEKLGDFEPHVGLRVAELSRKRVQEIYQIRTELETIVVRGFVAAASDDEIAVAQDYTRRMLAFAAEGDRIANVETMAEFERFMTRVADNEVAAEMLAQLNTRVSMLRLVAMRELGQIETNMAGLRAILAGIVARDADAAAQAVRTFVSHSGQSVLRYMDRVAATTELNATTQIADETEEDTAL
jgi:DNA-binding GntR family transcriptional regulator